MSSWEKMGSPGQGVEHEREEDLGLNLKETEKGE